MVNKKYASMPAPDYTPKLSPVFQSLFFLKQNSKLVLSVAIVIWTLTVCYAFLGYVPKFKSAASVLIKNSAITAKYVTADDISTSSSSAANPVLNTMSLLKSDLIADSLWNEFLAGNQKERERLGVSTIEEWREYFGDGKRFISYKNFPGTDVINMNFSWNDPKIAQQGLDIVLRAFKAASQQMNQTEHAERFEYLNSQIVDVQNKLKDVRKRISEYSKTYNISNIDKDIENYSKTRVTLEFDAANANAEVRNYAGQTALYQKALGLDSKSAVKAVALGGNPQLAKLFDNYYALSEDLSSLRSRYTDEHREIKDVKSKLAQTDQDIRHEMARLGIQADPNLVNRTIADETRGRAIQDMLDAEAKLKGSREKSVSMQQYLSKLNQKVSQLPVINQELANLKDEELSLSLALQTLNQKALDAQIREKQTLSNVFVISQPNVPKAPDFPGRTQVILIGLMIGTAAGLSAGLVKHKYLDSAQSDSANNSIMPIVNVENGKVPTHAGIN